MSVLDTVKLPEETTKTAPKRAGSILETAKVPERAHAFHIQQLQSEAQVSARNAEYQNSVKGLFGATVKGIPRAAVGTVKKFASDVKEGMLATPTAKKERTFTAGIIAGTKTAYDVYRETIDEGTKRWQEAGSTIFEQGGFIDDKKGFLNKETTKTEKGASLGVAGLGTLNVAFTPLTAPLQGGSSLPAPVGYVFDGINAVFGGIGHGSGAMAEDALFRIPGLSDKSKQALRPLVYETAALISQVVLGKGVEMAKGKLLPPPPPPRYRRVPVESEGETRNVPIETSKTRHQKYAEEQGYEPYTQPEQLPTIEMGDGIRRADDGTGLPVIDAETGQLRIQEKVQAIVDILKEDKGIQKKLIDDTVSEMPKDRVVEPAPEPKRVSADYDNALTQMSGAEAGYRFGRTNADGTFAGYGRSGSTFPDWVPEDLRLRSLFDKYLEGRDGTINDFAIKYDTGSRLDRLDKAVHDYLNKQAYSKEIEPSTIGGEAVTLETTPEARMGGVEEIGRKDTLMQPVERGGGELQRQRLASRIADRLEERLADDPNYNVSNKKIQGERASKLIETDWERAKRIALGDEMLDPSEGLLYSAVYEGVRIKAEMLGDVNTVLALTQSKYSGTATRMGQELSYLHGGDDLSPTNIIKNTLASQAEKSGKSVEAVEREISIKAEELKRKALSKEPTLEQKIRDIRNNIC